jgi:hypothetical protein
MGNNNDTVRYDKHTYLNCDIDYVEKKWDSNTILNSGC